MWLSQVNKKRHIGNDIVCVVFLDSSRTTFNPSWIRSHFIHCYVVVQCVQGMNGHPLYKVGVAHRTNVPSFQPSLKERCVFSHSHTFQQMLLTKIVNGERASYHAPRFLKLTVRILKMYLVLFLKINGMGYYISFIAQEIYVSHLKEK